MTDAAVADGGSDGGPACTDGQVDIEPCGNCGQMQRSCMGGVWQTFGACSGEGACAPGATETVSCGASIGACTAGTATRSCSASCAWGAAGTCGGNYVGPTPEVCGDGIDNNCNGLVDEGCSCTAVAIGHPGTVPVEGVIVKMVSDPSGCLVYVLDAGSPPSGVPDGRLLMLDSKNKAVAAPIVLPGSPSDVDISPNGQYLVASLPTAQQLIVIDKKLWAISATIDVASTPQEIEVGNDGVVYYVTVTQYGFSQTRRVDLALGTASDTTVGVMGADESPDIELSSDGNNLYSGDSDISGGKVKNYALASGMEVQVDVSIWDNGYGFPATDRWLLLSPNGQHIYYQGYQLAAGTLAHVTGEMDERIFAEDAAGTFAVGEHDIIDAQLVYKVATLPAQTTAAALTAGDQELWYWTAGPAMRYQNVGDFLAGVPLGQHARPAAPLSSYSFDKLVADPARQRIYGLDASHQQVVSIDTTTGLATGAIIVGSKPSDIEVSASGATLWIGHEGVLGLGKIDLASWQFSGFVPIAIDSFDIATVGDAWVVANDLDQWTTPILVNATSGAVVDKLPQVFEAAVGAAHDGKTVFVGESALSMGCYVARYDVSGGSFVQTATSGGYDVAPRALAVAPDGSFVFYAGNSLEGTKLTSVNYAEADTILNVTADERLAISATTVYRASDGKSLGSLPLTATVQAVSLDSTKLYVVSGGVLQTIDLTKF